MIAPYLAHVRDSVGFFIVQKLAGTAMSQVTNARLYNRYKAAANDKNDKLMASYLLLLKNRAALGSSEAQKYVDKINK